MSEPRAPARVRALPPAVANQIAAGEVVERPASVVKELLENSLDAGARTLNVELEQAGVRRIRVADDGRGIHREDLALALSRHATSKLWVIDDLNRLGTLGFRGEALPSIASVSRLALQSRVAGEETGWMVTAGGAGAQGRASPVAMAPGTVVEIRDLFYNTPARRRFLRAERTELKHVETVILNVALAREDVAVRARHGGRAIVSVGPVDDDAGRERRLARLLGKGFADAALPVDERASGLVLRGWVMAPEAARSLVQAQFFFLNRRPVRDAMVRHALRVAHEGALLPGLHAGYVLFLEMDPSEVDVNVHPAKAEVRFREARQVHDFLAAAVRRVVSRGEHGAGKGGAAGAAEDGLGVGEAPAPRFGSDPAAGGTGSTGIRDWTASPRHRGRSIPGPAGWVAPAALAGRADPPAAASGAGGAQREALGLVDRRYLLGRAAECFLVYDLAAALERLALHGLGAAGPPASQPLLMPEHATVPPATADAVSATAATLESLGLVLRRAGPGELSLRQMPPALRRVEPRAVLTTIVRWGSGSPAPELPVLIAGLGRCAAEIGPPLVDAQGRGRREALQAVLDELYAAGIAPVPPAGAVLDAAALERLIRVRRT